MAQCNNKIWTTNMCSLLDEECCFTRWRLDGLTDEEASNSCNDFEPLGSDGD